MTKKIEDYLHLYLGCEVLYKGEIHFLCGISKPYKTNDKTLATFSVRPNNKGFRSTIYSLSNFDDIKLILRPLPDMKVEERYKYHDLKAGGGFEGDAAVTLYLLNQGFDLFGLIPAGLAVDAATLTKNNP